MSNQLWQKFKQHVLFDSELGFGIDVSRVNFSPQFMDEMQEKMSSAFAAMDRLEGGAISNPDEKRMVGHYWLRSPERAPNKELQNLIRSTISDIKKFAAAVHQGTIVSSSGAKFESILLIGIGGSALGPQFVTQALGSSQDKLRIFFLDNTDPDGIQNVINRIPNLASTLCVVISKSGGTKETRNGQLLAKAAFEDAGFAFAKHAVAVTGEGSELHALANKEGWLRIFPMWDWVGGRTSQLSAVGLLPAALQGFDIESLLAGAAQMDELTRKKSIAQNPAALLALMWFQVGQGRGTKDMVVLPYKDRLELFSRYLQQLVMESLGKELDLAGKVVNQGIAVYGNKGSTDQHAYVQQLREGLANFFVTFIEVLEDASAVTPIRPKDLVTFEVEPGVRAGDYLAGFYLGTRAALYEKGRESITITIKSVSPRSVGQLIALFERAVGLYATLIQVNAYHQPGVEAGKKAAAAVLALQQKVEAYLATHAGPHSVEAMAEAMHESAQVETVYKIALRLAMNNRIKGTNIGNPEQAQFSK